jgi:hypothetical protein
MLYPHEVIVTTCGEYVHLKFIESFSFTTGRDEEDTVGKLKGDYRFGIRTISGRHYTVSSSDIAAMTDPNGSDVAVIPQSIFDKWKFIHKK